MVESIKHMSIEDKLKTPSKEQWIREIEHLPEDITDKMFTFKLTKEEISRVCQCLKNAQNTINEIFGKDERDSNSLRYNNIPLSIIQRFI